MSLQLKAVFGDLDLVAKSHVVNDATGLYVVTDNEGGYGTPNPIRADLLLYLIGQSSVYSLGVGDPTTATEFTYTYPSDGIYKFRIVGYEAATPPASLSPAALITNAVYVSDYIEHFCTLHLEAKMISLLDVDMADKGITRKNRAKYSILERVLMSARSQYAIGNPAGAERILNQIQNQF